MGRRVGRGLPHVSLQSSPRLQIEHARWVNLVLILYNSLNREPARAEQGAGADVVAEIRHELLPEASRQRLRKARRHADIARGGVIAFHGKIVRALI
jgi:hypothetical protein